MKLFGRLDCLGLVQFYINSFHPRSLLPIWLGRGKIPQPLSCPHPQKEQTQNKQRKSLDESFLMGLYLTAHGQGRHHPYFLTLFPSISHFFLSPIPLPEDPAHKTMTQTRIKGIAPNNEILSSTHLVDLQRTERIPLKYLNITKKITIKYRYH